MSVELLSSLIPSTENVVEQVMQLERHTDPELFTVPPVVVVWNLFPIARAATAESHGQRM